MPNVVLVKVVDRLAAHYGKLKPPPIKDPFELVLYENVSYLVDDDHRLRAFRNLKQVIGHKPEDLLSASAKQFESVIRMAGIDKKGRVAKLIACAEVAVKKFNGNVSHVLKMPYKKAVAAMKLFPSIGEPGAKKILLFCGVGQVLPLESNGMRVMVRLGFGSESSNYPKTYRSVREAVDGRSPIDKKWLIAAHLLLRKHGQTTCKSKQPDCDRCSLAETCTFGQAFLRKIYADQNKRNDASATGL